MPSHTHNIISFRDLLREKFPLAHTAQKGKTISLVSGVACLDEAGLSKGSITEVVGTSPGGGVGLIISALLSRPMDVVEPLVLVDGSDVFDPWSAPAASLEHLLWVRCLHADQAIRAADLLLRDGNMPLVMLDLQHCSEKEVRALSSSVWHRLRMLVEKSDVCLCAFTPCRTVPCAGARLVLQHRFTTEDQYRHQTQLMSELQGRVERKKGAALLWEDNKVAVAN